MVLGEIVDVISFGGWVGAGRGGGHSMKSYSWQEMCRNLGIKESTVSLESLKHFIVARDNTDNRYY